MSDHETLELRSLALARAVAGKIDADPTRAGLQRARLQCARWLLERPNSYLEEWREVLAMDWPEVRQVLISDSEHARQLRQNSPFSNVLSPRERWAIYRDAQS